MKYDILEALLGIIGGVDHFWRARERDLGLALDAEIVLTRQYFNHD